MTDRSKQMNRGVCLGIEGGGTRTTVLLADENDKVLEHFSAGPANLRLMLPGDLQRHLQGIREKLPFVPDKIGIGLAGVRVPSDHDRLRSAVARVWPGIACATSDDLLTALEAVKWPADCEAQILVLSGTGSCIAGRRRDGEFIKLGGRGHVLGDRASACDIAQHALRALMTISDQKNDWPELGADILAHLQMNNPEDLIDWSLVATKTELASVAVPVFRAAVLRPDDEIAIPVLRKAIARLAKDATSCATRIANGGRVQFVFNGAVLLKNPLFLKNVVNRLQKKWPNSICVPLERPSVWGSVEMGRKAVQIEARDLLSEKDALKECVSEAWMPVANSPTEQRNPNSMNFSELSISEGISLMLNEDATLPAAIEKESAAIEWTIEQVVRAFAEGGRLFYTGAGTSGRLGVLDASECPPTFRVPGDQVQGIIAGGKTALWSAVEGAEDDSTAGRLSVVMRKITSKDVVVGITASGHAPFVWGTLGEAKDRGAVTVLLCCNPGYKDHPLPDCVIAPDSGPEILTGSTRLKAGTATKLILNLITTLAMTHSGKVMSNLMIDMNPSNSKLRDRAIRIVSELTNASKEEAEEALRNAGWEVREACKTLGMK